MVRLHYKLGTITARHLGLVVLHRQSEFRLGDGDADGVVAGVARQVIPRPCQQGGGEGGVVGVGGGFHAKL